MKKTNSYVFSSGKKQQILNIFSALLSFVVGFGISFFLSPYLLEALGREAYSFYPLSTNITNAMTVVSSAMNSMACRYITISLVNKKNDDANKYYSSTLFVDFLYSLILLGLSVLFIVFIGVFLEIPTNLLTPVRLLFAFTIASAIVNIMSTVFGVATFATNRIELRSGREIVTALLRAVLFLLLYSFLPANLFYIGVVALAVAVASLAIQFVFTKRLLPDLFFSRANISKTHVKEILISSIWVSINSLGNIFLAGITLMVLNKFYGPEIGSHVSLAMTIPNLISGVITAIIGIFFPLITKNFADANYAELRKNIKKTQVGCGVFGCAVIVVFLAFAQSFYQLWVPTEDASLLTELTRYTLMPYLVISLFWVETYVNTATNDLKVPAIAMVCCGVVNIGCQVLLAALHVDYKWIVLVCSILQILIVGGFLPIYMARTIQSKWYEFFEIPVKVLFLSVLAFILSSCVNNMFTINSWTKFIVIGGGTGVFALALYAVGLIVMKKGWFASVWQIRK